MNFLFGGFFLPKIDERYYVNAWVRYGTNQYFLELNFIEWQEPKPYFYSKSFGLSMDFHCLECFSSLNLIQSKQLYFNTV